jgi:hypothetical protein
MILRFCFKNTFPLRYKAKKAGKEEVKYPEKKGKEKVKF